MALHFLLSTNLLSPHSSFFVIYPQPILCLAPPPTLFLLYATRQWNYLLLKSVPIFHISMPLFIRPPSSLLVKILTHLQYHFGWMPSTLSCKNLVENSAKTPSETSITATITIRHLTTVFCELGLFPLLKLKAPFFNWMIGWMISLLHPDSFCHLTTLWPPSTNDSVPGIARPAPVFGLFFSELPSGYQSCFVHQARGLPLYPAVGGC